MIDKIGIAERRGGEKSIKKRGLLDSKKGGLTL
jgi:hypothetical protein